MLDLNVQPEISIGNEHWSFLLGMPLYQAVQILQAHCRTIKTVEVVYQEKYVMNSDLVLNLANDGIRLMFDSRNQRLKTIQVFDVSKVKLKYDGNYFNSPLHRPTPEQIEQTFGATRPGQYDSASQNYIMSFRGLTFFFSANEQFGNYFTEHPTTHPATSSLAHDAVPVVSKMCIYSGGHLNDTVAPPIPASCYQGNMHLEKAEVLFIGSEAAGIEMKLVTSTTENSGGTLHLKKTVKFDDSVQHVLSELGSPFKIFYKPQDKMKIHSPSPRKLSESRHTDYFYNYFTLGIDILFDGKFHRAKKFLLHTNFPGHYNFNIYYRCDFIIKLVEGASTSKQTIVTVDPCTRWHDLKRNLCCDFGKPVVLNRASSTNNINPFGATFCFGLRNMIFEVMRNSHIAMVTLYKPLASSFTTSQACSS